MNSLFLSPNIGSLHATCPSQDTSRYEQEKRCQPMNLVIDPETTASTIELPSSWSTCIQPEGKVYFYHCAGSMTTVTESWIRTAEIASEVEKWIQNITPEVEKTGRDLRNAELYIRIDEDLDCFYYVVDRHAQTLFWINDLTTEVVGLPPVVSPSHLKTALEKEFWQHTDRFPAHFGGLQEEHLLRLLDAFAYIRADQITSCYTAFSHSAAETQAIYDVLERCRGRTHTSEVVGTVARGWNTVLFNRFHHLYSQETPRVDSRRPIFVEPEEDTEKHPFATRVMSFLTFRHSDYLRAEMNALFVDQFVRSFQVTEFVQERVQEWKAQVVPSLLMLLLHISFFFIPQNKPIAATSALLFSANLVSALTLIECHDGLTHKKDPEEINDWFGNQAIKKHRLQMTAFAFALPKAFFSWALVCFFGHWFGFGVTRMDLPFATALVGVLGITFYAFTFIIAPAEGDDELV